MNLRLAFPHSLCNPLHAVLDGRRPRISPVVLSRLSRDLLFPTCLPRTMSANETCDLDTQLLTILLKKRFHNEKPVELLSVETTNAAPKGDNYASLVRRVKMTCLTAGGRKKEFSVVVKTEHSGKGLKEAIKAFPVFHTETRIYTKILPMMEDLTEEFSDYREQLWPDLLGYQPYNMIAFCDLLALGYVRVERRNSLDFNHSKLVLRSMSRFHAMSRVLLERGLITSEDKGKLPAAAEHPVTDTWFACMITSLSEAMEDTWGQEWLELAKKLRNQMSVISGKLLHLSKEYDHRFDVLNHGDLWTCNMLFKYLDEEDDFPISVKFIDYPMANINSFVWDLIYFLITSTIPSVRRSKLNELLEIYQKSLAKNLKIFNYTGYIPTLEDVTSEWKRIEYAQLSVYMIQPFMTAETTDAFDMEKLTTHPPNEVVDESVYRDGKAIKGIGEDLRGLALKGLL